jgi:phospholipase/carboxylesterase
LSELGLGAQRDGILYVPESYSPDTPAPLFIGLHGAGQSSDLWASYPGRAEVRGMVFLAPDSRSSSTWDLMRAGFGPDVEFIDRALEHTFDRCLIDPERIAFGGFSDGASYALSLGVLNGDLFSHLVAYSPGLYVEPDSPVGQPSVFVSHGALDGILPVTASRNVIVPTGGHEVPAEISSEALDWFLGVG